MAKNSCLAEMWSGSNEGSYLRLIHPVSLNSRLESYEEEDDEKDLASDPARDESQTLSRRVHDQHLRAVSLPSRNRCSRQGLFVSDDVFQETSAR
jgi:hypothetical protein